MSEKIAIEVDQQSALAAHIEGLQRTLTKRNKRIAELEARLEGEGESEFIERLKQQAYSRGYRAAGGNLMEATRKFGMLLEGVHKEAFQVYLDGDKIGWDKQTYVDATGRADGVN